MKRNKKKYHFADNTLNRIYIFSEYESDSEEGIIGGGANQQPSRSTLRDILGSFGKGKKRQVKRSKLRPNSEASLDEADAGVIINPPMGNQPSSAEEAFGSARLSSSTAPPTPSTESPAFRSRSVTDGGSISKLFTPNSSRKLTGSGGSSRSKKSSRKLISSPISSNVPDQSINGTSYTPVSDLQQQKLFQQQQLKLQREEENLISFDNHQEDSLISFDVVNDAQNNDQVGGGQAEKKTSPVHTDTSSNMSSSGSLPDTSTASNYLSPNDRHVGFICLIFIIILLSEFTQGGREHWAVY